MDDLKNVTQNIEKFNQGMAHNKMQLIKQKSTFNLNESQKITNKHSLTK
jgi:hypothetical protein